MDLRARLQQEDGFGLIELMIATLVVTIALLALVAGFDSAAVSVHKGQLKATASSLANQQLELYDAMPFASIGLDATTTANVGNSANGAYDALYATNSILAGNFDTDAVTGIQTQEPSGTVNDTTISGCGSAPQCLPIQTITGADNHRYRIETFVVDVDDPVTTASIAWQERVVTVIVRDAQISGSPEITRATTAFDRGPQ